MTSISARGRRKKSIEGRDRKQVHMTMCSSPGILVFSLVI